MLPSAMNHRSGFISVTGLLQFCIHTHTYIFVKLISAATGQGRNVYLKSPAWNMRTAGKKCNTCRSCRSTMSCWTYRTERQMQSQEEVSPPLPYTAVSKHHNWFNCKWFCKIIIMPLRICKQMIKSSVCKIFSHYKQRYSRCIKNHSYTNNTYKLLTTVVEVYWSGLVLLPQDLDTNSSI